MLQVHRSFKNLNFEISTTVNYESKVYLVPAYTSDYSHNRAHIVDFENYSCCWQRNTK